jgi:hypothetical protein
MAVENEGSHEAGKINGLAVCIVADSVSLGQRLEAPHLCAMHARGRHLTGDRRGNLFDHPVEDTRSAQLPFPASPAWFACLYLGVALACLLLIGTLPWHLVRFGRPDVSANGGFPALDRRRDFRHFLLLVVVKSIIGFPNFHLASVTIPLALPDAWSARRITFISITLP